MAQVLFTLGHISRSGVPCSGEWRPVRSRGCAAFSTEKTQRNLTLLCAQGIRKLLRANFNVINMDGFLIMNPFKLNKMLFI